MITAIVTLIVCFLIGAQIGRKQKTDERTTEWYSYRMENPPSKDDIERTWRLAYAWQTLEGYLLDTGTTAPMGMADIFAWVIDLWVEDQDQMTVDGILNHCEEQVKEANGRLYHAQWIEACADAGLGITENGYMVILDENDDLYPFNQV